MKQLQLLRLTNETLGTLSCDNKPLCLTLEPPWRNNQQDVSCIPPGQYLCKRINSPKFGQTFEVLNVPNRTHILCGHWGNFVRDTEGCIIFGEGFRQHNDELMLIHSKRAFATFRKYLFGVDMFNLVISNLQKT